MLSVKADSSGFRFVGRSTSTAVATDRSLYNETFLCGDTIFVGCSRQPRSVMRFDGNAVLRTEETGVSIGSGRSCVFVRKALFIRDGQVCGVSFSTIFASERCDLCALNEGVFRIEKIVFAVLIAHSEPRSIVNRFIHCFMAEGAVVCSKRRNCQHSSGQCERKNHCNQLFHGITVFLLYSELAFVGFLYRLFALLYQVAQMISTNFSYILKFAQNAMAGSDCIR